MCCTRCARCKRIDRVVIVVVVARSVIVVDCVAPIARRCWRLSVAALCVERAVDSGSQRAQQSQRTRSGSVQSSRRRDDWQRQRRRIAGARCYCTAWRSVFRVAIARRIGANCNVIVNNNNNNNNIDDDDDNDNNNINECLSNASSSIERMSWRALSSRRASLFDRCAGTSARRLCLAPRTTAAAARRTTRDAYRRWSTMSSSA